MNYPWSVETGSCPIIPSAQYSTQYNGYHGKTMEKTPKNTPALRIHSKHTSQQTSNIPKTILFLYSAKRFSNTFFFAKYLQKIYHSVQLILGRYCFANTVTYNGKRKTHRCIRKFVIFVGILDHYFRLKVHFFHAKVPNLQNCIGWLVGLTSLGQLSQMSWINCGSASDLCNQPFFSVSVPWVPVGHT